MEHDLIERGVPKDKIVRVSHNAGNTREEAQALAQQALERKWRSVIVVTSNYHTRRARYIFLHVFPSQTLVRVSGSHDGDFDPEHWWQARNSLKEFTREFAGMLVAMWELRGQPKVSAIPPAVVGLNGLNPLYLV
jgi:vancomycin permeability regulator SanA